MQLSVSEATPLVYSQLRKMNEYVAEQFGNACRRTHQDKFPNHRKEHISGRFFLQAVEKWGLILFGTCPWNFSGGFVLQAVESFGLNCCGNFLVGFSGGTFLQAAESIGHKFLEHLWVDFRVGFFSRRSKNRP